MTRREGKKSIEIMKMAGAWNSHLLVDCQVKLLGVK